ncbi:cbb3-type cytochrome oxidase assembly protein CcoS [uncultured Aquincola sp.]|uniref:cbb3-type cytochrome oxidase assembly protein CcoS n=1 Tax=uncultured Aquincola sp. TaxID=886556 RepID=UPI0032B11B36|tara:strand:- start:232 stop:408 length:177 start_codon:yes stop_codon:yes gene_type:complete
MDILYLLIPLSALLVLGIMGAFAWALFGGQFDDLQRAGEDILQEGVEAPVSSHGAGPA